MGTVVKRVQSHRYRVARDLFETCYHPADFLFRGSRLRRAVARIHRADRAYWQRNRQQAS